MKYLLILVTLGLAFTALTSMGPAGRAAVWIAIRPYLLPVITAAVIVGTIVLLANGGSSLRIL